MRRMFGIWWRFMVLSVFLLCLAAVCYAAFVSDEPKAFPPRNFGNFERVIKKLHEKQTPQEFSFAVVGDPRGFGTFESIMELLKDEHLAFMVLLGDCTKHPRLGDHLFFQAEIATETATPYPIFYVPGNHDVEPGRFTLQQFEEFYGPTQFYFLYGNQLFLMLRVLPEDDDSMEETLAFAEKVLKAERRKAESVFVFQHIPPPLSKHAHSRRIAQPEKLLELFERYRVDYVFAGDYHGYFRTRKNGTVYLVTGGGGAPLKNSKYARFHHAVVVTVGPEGVSERILVVPPRYDVEDRLEYVAIATVWPFVEQNPLATAGISATALIGVPVMLVGLIRCLRKKHSES